jgi:predicted patatin/cPLA2 family phospholipase
MKMNKKVALVLEGGGFRGSYTAGALRWLLKEGIEFDYVVGTSAAAVYSFYFLAKNDRMLHDISIDAVKDPNMLGIKPLLLEGQLGGFGLMVKKYVMPTYQQDLKAARDSGHQMEVCLYNMTRDEPEICDLDDFDGSAQIIRAACTLPVSGRMVKVNGQKYLDGGIKTMLAIDRARELGYEKALVIVTKDKNYVRKPYSRFTLGALGLIYGKHPNMLKILKGRTDEYYREMNEVYAMEQQGKAVLIRPTRDCGVKRFSGSHQQLEEMHALGMQDMEDRRDELYDFLELPRED